MRRASGSSPCNDAPERRLEGAAGAFAAGLPGRDAGTRPPCAAAAGSRGAAAPREPQPAGDQPLKAFSIAFISSAMLSGMM
jgi:hypothetical protein